MKNTTTTPKWGFMPESPAIDFGPLTNDWASFQSVLHKIVGRYSAATHIPYDDLQGAALDGMIRALGTYVPGHGASLHTWVYRNIVDAVRGYIWDENREPATVGLASVVEQEDEDAPGYQDMDSFVSEVTDPFAALLFREILESLSPDSEEVLRVFLEKELRGVHTPTQTRRAIRECLVGRRRTARPAAKWTPDRVRSAFKELKATLTLAVEGGAA